ncbi:MAG TPA: hypothetical protein VKG05_12815, partial [Steroidobacteraceae bacterium]|nr:hypothetical protein [Steroidobacteraceae bacterium]
MSLAARQLLLDRDATITCPNCAREFSLDQGFGQQVLEQLAEASAGAILAMRDAERATVERLVEASVAARLEESRK